MITRARVRDQQASRAFAAELLAPADYIRSRVSNEVMSAYRAHEIAEELDASMTVVKYQARNNYIEFIG
jgi:Zn-dependent peptidase ImmA (M78 family)